MRLKNKIAIVTGGSMGIGQATAARFAQEGAKVIIVDIAQNEGRETERMLRQYDPECLFIPGDVTRESDWQNVMNTVERNYGHLDILFNNAGTNLIKPATEIKEEEWDRIITLNLKGVFFGMKHSVSMMVKAGGGSIINTASTTAFIALPKMSVYTASKGGILALTRQLAADYAQLNIRVNCVCPGVTLTPLVQREMDLGLVTAEALIHGVPMGRFAKPSEIAAAVLFLASDDASYVTGTALIVDGGRTVH
jgi:NAD(P)-dependent dehydrogenase (short-subunit alcohol dehydrogenase family)